MLTPDYLDALPRNVVELYRQVEDDILRDVARRIGKMDEITATADWQTYRLQETAAVRAEVVKTLSKYSGKSEAIIRQMMRNGCTEALTADDAEYLAMGLAPSALNQNSALLNLLNAGYLQTLGTWRNLTATTANTVAQQFEAALDRAWLQVSSGAFDYNTAIKSAVDNLAANMQYVTYPTGKRDTLEVAVRRAVLTGVNQTACKLQLARADEMGCEYVEVSAHSGARSDGSRGPADHAYWQGKVYHRGGAIDFNGTRYEDFVTATGYGSGEGLAGWNCRHNFHQYWPGVSVPAYTPERLAELNAKNIEYNGKMYSQAEIDEKQRAKERSVRAAKKRYLAEYAAGVDSSKAAKSLKGARKRLEEFISATGGKPDSARISTPGFGRSASSRATAAARK